MHTYYMFSLSSFMQFFMRGIFDADKEKLEPSRYNSQFLKDSGVVEEDDLNKLGEDIEKRVEEINLKDALLADSDMGGDVALYPLTYLSCISRISHPLSCLSCLMYL